MEFNQTPILHLIITHAVFPTELIYGNVNNWTYTTIP